jgi:hypothetical protein
VLKFYQEFPEIIFPTVAVVSLREPSNLYISKTSPRPHDFSSLEIFLVIFEIDRLVSLIIMNQLTD